jgi:ribosomal protein S6--L-glutamate ligase
MALEEVGGLPAIVKLTRGAQGRGVLLAHNLASIQTIILALQSAGEPALIQEYLAEANGKDTRVIVIGGQAVAAMERSAAPGNFRSNLHQGGSARPVTLSTELEGLAVSAAAALGLQVGGVDILLARRGPLVLEVNASPGLEGIERATGRDLAREIVLFLEKESGVGRSQRRLRARPHRRRRK